MGSYDIIRLCVCVRVCGCDPIPGLWGGLPGAIVAGAGGVMLVGGAPTRSRQNLCTTHYLFENRSFVDFEIGHESAGGDLEKNVHIQVWKCVTHQTRSMEHHVSFLITDRLSILKKEMSRWGRS